MEINKNHIFHYLALLIILTGGALSIFLASNKNFQILLLFATAFFYFLWGVFHHFLNHDLHFKTVVEYALIAILGATLLVFALRNGLIF